MSQADLASSLATQIQATTVDVYASRDNVNVIIPGTGYRGEGNHHYSRPAGPVSTWLVDLVTEVIKSEPSLKWQARGFEVLRSGPLFERGHYRLTVWIPKR